MLLTCGGYGMRQFEPLVFWGSGLGKKKDVKDGYGTSEIYKWRSKSGRVSATGISAKLMWAAR
jgi:hypothetical protein